MNPVDLIFALLVLLAVARGYSRGLLGTIAGYGAPVVAFLVASDWSDPVRDRLAESIEAPEIVLDMLAPFVVFVVVVVVIRLVAAVLARALGLGLSMPGRVLAAAAGATVTALVLGAGVVVVDRMNGSRVETGEAPGTPEDAIVSPARNLLANLDRRFDESLLAPPMAALAASVVREVLPPEAPLIEPAEVEQAAREAAGAAVGAVGQAAIEGAVGGASAGGRDSSEKESAGGGGR